MKPSRQYRPVSSLRKMTGEHVPHLQSLHAWRRLTVYDVCLTHASRSLRRPPLTARRIIDSRSRCLRKFVTQYRASQPLQKQFSDKWNLENTIEGTSPFRNASLSP